MLLLLLSSYHCITIVLLSRLNANPHLYVFVYVHIKIVYKRKGKRREQRALFVVLQLIMARFVWRSVAYDIRRHAKRKKKKKRLNYCLGMFLLHFAFASYIRGYSLCDTMDLILLFLSLDSAAGCRLLIIIMHTENRALSE